MSEPSGYKIKTAPLVGAPDGEMFDIDSMPPESITKIKIIATKNQIGSLLEQIDPSIELSNIDSVIQQQMEKRNITPTFNPTDTNQTQYKQLTPLITQLQKENLKIQIKNLLQRIDSSIQITDENIDSVIATKLVENGIDSTQTQFYQLTELKRKLQEKKGGKKHKSKRYRKSRKQRKTKRRLRRSYKYK